MNPRDRRYSATHEWAKIEGNVVTVGISKHAVEELTDLVYLQLPSVGDAVTAGSPFGEIESVKAVAELNSPVDGEVVEANTAIAEKLDAVSKDPYGAGWIVKIKASSPGQLDALMTAEQYEKHLAEEAKKR
ncbi:MAG: glycine cleavage system protein GcvH [Planctomycetes bacterium]|nr:glycine cleavage system protein GcvH [Planctomycetota bacterium]